MLSLIMITSFCACDSNSENKISYKSSMQIMITYNKDANSFSQNDIVTSKELATTIIEVMLTQSNLHKTIEDLDFALKYTPNELKKKIEINNIENTSLFDVSVIDSNSETAENILAAFITNSKSTVNSVFTGFKIGVVTSISTNQISE